MEKSETLLFKGCGGGNFGYWISGSWPFATIEVFEDRISYSLFLKKADIPFHLVRYVERIGRVPVLADGIYIEIDNSKKDVNFPGFITFFGFRKINELKVILEKKCDNLLPKRPWYRNQLHQIIIFFALIVLIFAVFTV